MDIDEYAEEAAWAPKTKVGVLVKSGRIRSIEEIFAMGKTIMEVGIVDALIPKIEDKVLEIASVQRMTKNNRRQKFRVTVAVGDRNGHIGIGVGKDVEVKPAIETAIRDAKKNIISIRLGCGSWECNCGTQHTLPLTETAKCGSSFVTLKPAPRGVGIVAAETMRSVLELAGVKDVWTYSRGRTRNVYNVAVATVDALKKVTEIKNMHALKALQ
ncbi:MAG: 30S ribosomal protein S5 [Candidatus Marsarchaeota archaeon]|nr:30S ribosomal protein S5 [Candidatus Marsarchaeota archaeon]